MVTLTKIHKYTKKQYKVKTPVLLSHYMNDRIIMSKNQIPVNLHDTTFRKYYQINLNTLPITYFY